MAYGTVARLYEDTQITTSDLFLHPSDGQSEQERLDEIMAELLEDASEIVNLDRKRDFDEEQRLFGQPVPRVVVRATYRIAANILEYMLDQQRSKIAKRDNMEIDFGLQDERFIDSDTRRMLMLVDSGDHIIPGFGFRMSRARSTDEILAGIDEETS